MKRLFRRRWLFLIGIPLVLLAGVYVWLLTLPGSGRITRANHDKIQVGMTIKEVDELLGDVGAQQARRIGPDGRTEQIATVYITQGMGFLPQTHISLDFAEGRVIKKQYRGPTWNLFELLPAIRTNKPPPPMPPGARPPVPAGTTLPSPRPGVPAAPGPASQP